MRLFAITPERLAQMRKDLEEVGFFRNETSEELFALMDATEALFKRDAQREKDLDTLREENERLKKRWEEATYARCVHHGMFCCTECTLACLAINKDLEKKVDELQRNLAAASHVEPCSLEYLEHLKTGKPWECSCLAGAEERRLSKQVEIAREALIYVADTKVLFSEHCKNALKRMGEVKS